jgi:hypothetical protein
MGMLKWYHLSRTGQTSQVFPWERWRPAGRAEEKEAGEDAGAPRDTSLEVEGLSCPGSERKRPDAP